MVRVATTPGLFDEADEIHVSVTFTWDTPLAEHLAGIWEAVAPVKIGGVAMGDRGGDFVPGMYVKRGYVITSRGCPNRCWFCSVWRREGSVIRELPIAEGWNVLDDNLLACSETHIRAVFAMLKQQPQRAEFTGGMEAARLKDWHVELLTGLNPKQIFFAYDTPDDYEPLLIAGNMLTDAGIIRPSSHAARAYVLCGYRGDTFEAAENRMMQTIGAGFMPMAMLYRDTQGKRDPEWMRFQRTWARPAIIGAKKKI